MAEQKWSGYSDYQSVAETIHRGINEANDWFAHADSRIKQGRQLTSNTAIQTRASMLAISKRLAIEIKKNSHIDDPFGQMWERWRGEDGYLNRMESLNLHEEFPPWLSDFMDDIIAAGWELGYLKAGMEKPADPDDDLQQAKAMFK